MSSCILPPRDSVSIPNLTIGQGRDFILCELPGGRRLIAGPWFGGSCSAAMDSWEGSEWQFFSIHQLKIAGTGLPASQSHPSSVRRQRPSREVMFQLSKKHYTLWEFGDTYLFFVSLWTITNRTAIRDERRVIPQSSAMQLYRTEKWRKHVRAKIHSM